MKLTQSLPKLSKLKLFKTWYGEADIATLVNHAGFWESKDGTEHVESRNFDNDPETICHSDPIYEKQERIIGVEFKVYFYHEVTHLKHLKKHDSKKYNRNQIYLTPYNLYVETQILSPNKFCFNCRLTICRTLVM